MVTCEGSPLGAIVRFGDRDALSSLLMRRLRLAGGWGAGSVAGVE